MSQIHSASMSGNKFGDMATPSMIPSVHHHHLRSTRSTERLSPWDGSEFKCQLLKSLQSKMIKKLVIEPMKCSSMAVSTTQRFMNSCHWMRARHMLQLCFSSILLEALHATYLSFIYSMRLKNFYRTKYLQPYLSSLQYRAQLKYLRREWMCLTASRVATTLLKKGIRLLTLYRLQKCLHRILMSWSRRREEQRLESMAFTAWILVYLSKNRLRRGLMRMHNSSSGSVLNVAEEYDEVDLDDAVISTPKKHRRNAGRLLRVALDALIDQPGASNVVLIRNYSLDICRMWSKGVVDGMVASDDKDDSMNSAVDVCEDSGSIVDSSDSMIDGALDWSSPLLIPSIRKQMMSSLNQNIRRSNINSSRSKKYNDRLMSGPHPSSYLDRSMDAMTHPLHDTSSSTAYQSFNASPMRDSSIDALNSRLFHRNGGGSNDHTRRDSDSRMDDDDGGLGMSSFSDHLKRPCQRSISSSCAMARSNSSERVRSNNSKRPLHHMQMCSADSMLYDSALSMSFELTPHPTTICKESSAKIMHNLQFCGFFQDDDSDEEELRERRRLSAETMDKFRLIKFRWLITSCRRFVQSLLKAVTSRRCYEICRHKTSTGVVRGSWRVWRDVLDKWRRKGCLCDSIYRWKLLDKVFNSWRLHAVDRMYLIMMMIQRNQIDRLLRSSLVALGKEYHMQLVIADSIHRMDLFRSHALFSTWRHFICRMKTMRRSVYQCNRIGLLR